MGFRQRQAQAEEFYSVHKEKIFYENLIEYMTSGPIVVMVLEGLDVVQRYRELMGKTNPDEAAEGTIRKLFAFYININFEDDVIDAPDGINQDLKSEPRPANFNI